MESGAGGLGANAGGNDFGLSPHNGGLSNGINNSLVQLDNNNQDSAKRLKMEQNGGVKVKPSKVKGS